MGSFGELFIGKVKFLDTKYDVYPVAMTVFQESDKMVRRTRQDGAGLVLVCKYSTDVRTPKSRLGVMGFSLRNTEADFKARKADKEKDLMGSVESELESIGSRAAGQIDSGESVEFHRQYLVGLEGKLETLKAATFEMYLRGFQEIHTYESKHRFFPWALPSSRASRMPRLSPFAKFMLSQGQGHDEDEYEYLFPCSDWRFLLRAFLEKLPDNLDVAYDCTELVNGGYYQPDDAICAIAKESLTEDYPQNEKIVVLTEGSTDASILKASLDLLYPELAEYYSFMDFGRSRAPGGAATLVQTVKAFIASGIANRIVALFDNDTAGREALRALSSVPLPSNARAMTYPAIELGKNYPSIGPNGLSILDINGLARSIELFLGQDVLAAKGKLSPVQWTGFNRTLGQYQGEVMGKAELQECFLAKLDACRRGNRKTTKSDWSEMHTLLRTLFSAFQ